MIGECTCDIFDAVCVCLWSCRWSIAFVLVAMSLKVKRVIVYSVSTLLHSCSWVVGSRIGGKSSVVNILARLLRLVGHSSCSDSPPVYRSPWPSQYTLYPNCRSTFLHEQLNVESRQYVLLHFLFNSHDYLHLFPGCRFSKRYESV